MQDMPQIMILYELMNEVKCKFVTTIWIIVHT